MIDVSRIAVGPGQPTSPGTSPAALTHGHAGSAALSIVCEMNSASPVLIGFRTRPVKVASEILASLRQAAGAPRL